MSRPATAEIRCREASGNRAQPVGTNRHRALVRLYERRAAVDQLISALERYQRDLGHRPEVARCEELSAIGMWL